MAATVEAAKTAKARSKPRTITKHIEIGSLPEPEVVRFRTAAGKMREQARRIAGEVACPRGEIDFEELLKSLDEMEGYAQEVRLFAEQFVTK